ncbi:unnamed protein product [Ceutorhynchus assimilis]|uniref:ZSWIM3 N-terminal domain-containing protein n=1 Tax=Ceutorhynchus assimilis TaxID=467358 RepID=A0A9N9MI74_9CUCU|nr:unnamed protein product [Ceutorhynchus assimilis]
MSCAEIEIKSEDEDLVESEEEPQKWNLDSDSESEHDKGETVLVDLGFSVGDRFATFEEFKSKFAEVCKANYVRFYRRDSRSIQGAKHRIKRSLKPELKYYYSKYTCFFSSNNKPKGTGKRNRLSLSRNIPATCPALIFVNTTDDGQFLQVSNVENFHNHPVSEEEYQQLLPKKPKNLL